MGPALFMRLTAALGVNGLEIRRYEAYRPSVDLHRHGGVG